MCLLHSMKFPHLVMGSLKSSLNGLVLSQPSAMTTCMGHRRGWNKWQLLHASDTLAFPRRPYPGLKMGLVGGWARCNAAWTQECLWNPMIPLCFLTCLLCSLTQLRLAYALQIPTASWCDCHFPQHGARCNSWTKGFRCYRLWVTWKKTAWIPLYSISLRMGFHQCDCGGKRMQSAQLAYCFLCSSQYS